MKKRKIRRTMGVFFTTFLLLQIILLHIPQELRIRSRGTERHSASN